MVKCVAGLGSWVVVHTDVSEGMTEAISATALAPPTPSLQLAMPMLTMLLPFIAAMISSEDAWSSVLQPTSICARKEEVSESWSRGLEFRRGTYRCQRAADGAKFSDILGSNWTNLIPAQV